MAKSKRQKQHEQGSLFPEGALTPIAKPEKDIRIVEVRSTFSEDSLEILRSAENDDDLVLALGKLLDIDNGSDLDDEDKPPLFIQKLWAIKASLAARRAAARFYMIDKLMRWKWTQDGLNPMYVDEWSQGLIDTYNHFFMRYPASGNDVQDLVSGLKLYGEVMEAVAAKRPHGKAVFKDGTSQGELHRLANGEDGDPDRQVHWHPAKKVGVKHERN